MNSLRIASVIASKSAGGIGPVCHYAAKEIARQTGWNVTLVSLHDPPNIIEPNGLNFRDISLGLNENCSRRFLDWLRENPQDLVITSGVSHIESAFKLFPSGTRHIVQIHDCLKQYKKVAVQYSAFIDGIVCVARHIEESIQQPLAMVGYHGMLKTIHNGAAFPEPIRRAGQSSTLKLLYMGRLDPFKGIFDLPIILHRLRKMDVPATLTIVGGESCALMRDFARRGVSDAVTWAGIVPHEECYTLAAEADLLLMPSRKEPFGMVTIEAMAMGCVPMAYDVPSGSTEIIEHNQSGILIPLGDYNGWANAIRELSPDRQRLTTLSLAASSRSRSVFSSENMARSLSTFVQDVMANSKIHPSKREIGTIPLENELQAPSASGYQRIPRPFRQAIRNKIGRHPRVCHWILDRL